MDRSSIDTLGIAHLTAVLARTGRVAPDLKDNDKDLCWDGNLLLYVNDTFKKENLYSVIPVQVKSHIVEEYSNKHVVDKKDLQNFKLKGMILFFIVEILEDDKEFKIYFKSMLRFDIEKMLDEFKDDQESKTFEFDEFPQDSAKIIALMKKISDDNSKVNNVIGTIKSIGDFVDKKGTNKALSFDVTLPRGYHSFTDICSAVEEQKPYIYYHDEYTETSFTIDKFTNMQLIIKTVKSVTVRLENKVYYKKAIMQYTSKEKLAILGECIVFHLNKGSTKISFKMKGDLPERINALSFLIGLANKQKLYINNQEIEFGDIESTVDIDELKRLLDFYQKALNVLEYMHVDKKPYDASDCDDKKASLLLDIYKCIFLKEPVGLIKPKNGPAYLRVFGLKLLCMIVSGKNNSYITDFFDERIKISLKDEKGNVISDKSSIYLILVDLNDKPFDAVDNIDFEVMINSIFSKKLSNDEYIRAVNVFLNLLKYYDEKQDKSILGSAIKFAKKLDEIESSAVSKINLYQCYIRKRPLSKHEKEFLLRITCETNDKDEKFGCFVLLGQIREANELLKGFSEAQKEELKLFPIYNLYEKLIAI